MRSNSVKAATVCVASLATISLLAHAQQEIPIPRSVAGDEAKYYLLEAKRTGALVRALHKRVAVDSVGYTITEVICKTMLVRDIGYSEESPAKIKENPTNWFDLVRGSSKSDVAQFVCKL
jgi:hypothetical protein